ncbi:MAG: PD-(D/E)XK nuclease family protein, partial [Clostridiales bacterium]|nr:PD-(D/E)XK nuclease family protein [Clostridiales bacterium]
YIDGFPDFTRQNLAILDYLMQASPEVTISMNCDCLKSGLLAFEKAGDTAGELCRLASRAGVEIQIEVIRPYEIPLKSVRESLFQGAIQTGELPDILHTVRAQSPWQECIYAAQRVRQLVEEGGRYRDISVVCTDLPAYQPLMDMVFHRFHIPLYRSGTEEILQNSVINTVLSALDAAIGGFDQRETLRYLRSALSPVDSDTCDLLENYAVIWGIRGSKWTQSWTGHPEGLSGQWDDDARQTLTWLNEVRYQVIAPLQRLQSGFRDAKNLRGQVLALTAFLEDIRLQQQLTQMAQELDETGSPREAQILNQLWEILLSALEQMYAVLGDTVWEPEHFSRLFRLLLSQYDVGTIPPVLDAVQMGTVSAMRCHRQKHLIVLGAEEGKLPGYSGSAGVLTDQERVILRQLGVPLTGGSMEGIQAEFAEIYGVFCGAEETIAVCCSGDQPSFLFRRLSQMAGREEPAETLQGYAQADAYEAGACLARWNAKKTAKKLDVLPGYEDAAQKRDYCLGEVQRKSVQALYGSTLNLSASQIDRQAECRLSYFLKYGLRAKERKEAAIDPAEFGTYVHAVLENTARCIREMGGFHKVTLEQTMEIAHRFSQEYAEERFSQLDSQRMAYLFRRNVQELDMVVRELWQELKNSGFEPVKFELGFGTGEALPPIAIPNHAMNAVLRGFVDRVDVWDSGASRYFRVVDYKTGKKDFDYCDVYNGVGLQMLLYLFALGENGEDLLGGHPIPAGVQYFPARAPYLNVEGKLDAEAAQKERTAQWKRKGLLLNDETVLQAMEPGDNPCRSYTRKKDGTIAGDLADREQLKKLKEFVFRILSGMVEDIASGNVDPNPYTRGTSHNACAFCPYGAICHQAEVEGRRSYKAMSAQRFWEEIEKEGKSHGR